MKDQEPICYYCSEPMGDEYHYVIKDGTVVMAHKSCQAKSQVGNIGPLIGIKGNSCPGGTCGL